MSSNPQQPNTQQEEVDADAPKYTFDSDEAAIAGRKEGVALYNKGEYDQALEYQISVVRYFTEKYGEKHAVVGIYYLDYGLTLLSLIQGTGRNADAAALKGVDEDEAETCFIILEFARVCFEKAEDEQPDDVEVKYRVTEVHDALAQLELEKDNNTAALAEFEHTLLLLRDMSPTEEKDKKRQSQAIASALFNCAGCYMSEQDYEGAAEKYKECLDFVATLAAGAVDAELIEEVNTYYADAVENRDNKTFLKVKSSIQELFPDEKHEVMAEEVLGKAQEGGANPFLSALPGGEGGNTSSLLMPGLIAIPGREHSNSTSRSVFPMQGTGDRSRSSFSASNGPVNVAVARKKEKKPAVTGDAAATIAAPSEGEPAAKKIRPEA